jgi:hypothetical protein
MKRNRIMKSNDRKTPRAAAGARLDEQKVREQIARSRKVLLAESAVGPEPEQHMLRLALNEAESLAWQTRYPDLVFPVLAAEKLQALTDWKQRQDFVWQSSPMLSLAE